MTPLRRFLPGLGDGAESTEFPFVPKEPLVPESPLQPMDQLLALVATLAGHGIRLEHTMYAYRIPAELFEQLPGGDPHEWTTGAGTVCRSKKVEFGNAVSLILMTAEEAEAEV